MVACKYYASMTRVISVLTNFVVKAGFEHVVKSMGVDVTRSSIPALRNVPLVHFDKKFPSLRQMFTSLKLNCFASSNKSTMYGKVVA